MNLKDSYLHGSDSKGLIRTIEVGTGQAKQQDGTTTGIASNKSVLWIETALPNSSYNAGSKFDKYSNNPYKWIEIPIYNINVEGSASKLSNTTAIGSTTLPVYFTDKGIPSTCTYSLNATVPAGTANYILYYSAANTLATQSYTTLTSNLNVFTYHATTAASNKKGLVPAPTVGLGGLYLRSDGTWQTIATTDTNTKVTQTGGLTSAGDYELILSKSANDTTETNTVNKTSRLTYNPNTYSFTNGGCTQLYDATNKCLKFIFD